MTRLWFIAALLLTAAAPARADIIDPTGDWLATYTGAHNPDLDLVSASARFDGSNFLLSSTQNGAVGTSTGSLFVWGIDRGAGTARLGALGAPPPVGVDKLFDALAVLLPNGVARIVTFPAAGAPTITVLNGAAIISGDTISTSVPLSLLPSTGFNAQDYTFTLWSRLRVDPAKDGNNHEIADFAPNFGSFNASVPEPSTWAMMIAGFGLVGGMLRTKRRPRLHAMS